MKQLGSPEKKVSALPSATMKQKLNQAPEESTPFTTSPLPFALETLPFTTRTPNSMEDLFADHDLPMRSHRGDLLAKLLDKSLELELFGVLDGADNVVSKGAQRGNETAASGSG